MPTPALNKSPMVGDPIRSRFLQISVEGCGAAQSASIGDTSIAAYLATRRGSWTLKMHTVCVARHACMVEHWSMHNKFVASLATSCPVGYRTPDASHSHDIINHLGLYGCWVSFWILPWNIFLLYWCNGWGTKCIFTFQCRSRIDICHVFHQPLLMFEGITMYNHSYWSAAVKKFYTSPIKSECPKTRL